jgi:alpha-mannosidase
VETDYYTVTMAEDGSFQNICLKNGQVIVENANRLQVFMDVMDAWDFEDDYRDQPEMFMHLDGTKVRQFGNLTEIVQNYSFQNSRLVQTILLHKELPYIQIDHDVDWKDTWYMIRAEFAPKVWNDVVHSDIQFGYLDRPTTDNDAHEKAQFEICCQKWLDISDEKRGFAVLNNAKNGFMAKNGMISLNLLRSTDYPCVAGDQNPTHYSYAFYPHDGGFNPVLVDQIAGEYGERCLYGDVSGEIPGFDSPNIQVTAFKPAYDGNGFIVRGFERSGKSCDTKLTIPKGFTLCSEVNLLEDPMGEAGENLSWKPFQIRSFRLHKDGGSV